MNRFKQEVASEIGVPLKEGYNGDLTSAQAGSIGGEMVKKNDHEAGRTDVRQIKIRTCGVEKEIVETAVFFLHKKLFSF